jgi:hypothetical protein
VWLTAGGSESLAEADLVVFGEALIAEQDYEILVPAVEHLGKRLVAHRCAQIDADDFGADCRR